MEENSQLDFPVLSSPIISSGTNPLGKLVVLKEGTWEHHINSGHCEVDQAAIIRNITNPSYITSSKSNTNDDSGKQRYNYYSLTTYNDGVYCLNTVTESIDNVFEDIVTSHVMKKITTKGEIIYEKD